VDCAGRNDSVYNSLKIEILYYDLAKHIPGFVRMSPFWEMHFGYIQFAHTGGGVELTRKRLLGAGLHG